MTARPAIARLVPRALARHSGSSGLDVEASELIGQQRERAARPLGRPGRLASIVSASTFFAVASPLAVLQHSARTPSAVTLLLLIASYAVASQVAFEVGAGIGVATELVLVPMLFLVPLGLVPLLVCAGLLAGELMRHAWRGVHLERLAILPGNAWYAVGPAAMLLAAGEHSPRWSDWPVYAGALAAQFALDYASSAAREWIAFGVSPRSQLRFIGSVWPVDGALACIGLLAAFASASRPHAFLLVVPVIGLLALFARERAVGIDRALELSSAYRGTAFLLGDVVEADDAYTGSHSRDVVDLVLAVANELGIDAEGRRDAEFAALLHDIGKIRIPKSLINKPGSLTSEERQLLETHTVEGERMLSKVGGLLGEVGHVVRSHHERYDGGGYPDGLSGNEIPLVARIVSCCDAFNAMTTDRPYRRARPAEAALAELHAESGKQFDPVVVQALARVVGRDRR
jgi:putative nucleotidyltransferase with HDIG domain